MIDQRWDDLNWYLLYTHSKQEDRAARNLAAWGVVTFIPWMRQKRYDQHIRKWSITIKPLFPRYVFAQFSLNRSLQKIRFTRGVHSVVSFDQNPARVDEEIIRATRAHADKEGFITFGDELRPGDKVVIRDGPLCNFMGIFEQEMQDADRIKILLDTVKYQGHVIISRSDVQKKC